jgi:hypothetical protein
MIRNVSPKPVERSVGRYVRIPGIGRRPDDGAVLERARRLRGLPDNDEGSSDPCGSQYSLHPMSSLDELVLAAERGSAAIDLRLRDSAGRDQSFDTALAQLVAVAAHAVLQASGLKSPLAAEPAVILGALSLAGGHG